MTIDTHAHLNFAAFQNDRYRVLEKCLDENIWVINVGSQAETSQIAVEMAEKYKGGVFAAVGFHPVHAEKNEKNNFSDAGEIKKKKESGFNYEKFKEMARKKSVVAIGETGLDYYRIKKEDLAGKNLQREIFTKHIELARELEKPLIVHCRDAHDDVLEILNSKSSILNSKNKGVLHCFSGNLKQAEKYRSLGFKIGFTGIITFSRNYDDVVKNTPLKDILIETDCPYLTPEPYRGKRNEPIYVIEVAKKIAEIKDISYEEVIGRTTENAKELFRI
ncbi:TatD family hydrolase [Candidatus Wolfebacteria bacterium]|nr:TatD family hydrolase [Candidatus Wolfebacteria bacterium]